MGRAAELSDTKRQLLEKLLRGDAVAPIGSVTARPRGTPVPISAEQRNVWAHAAMAPDVPLYNEPITIHRRGSFDLAVLERSLNEILRRHEIWRTSFTVTDGDIEQVVHDDLQVTLPLIDLSHLPRPARAAAALRLATEQATTPIDLARAPLFRARVLRLAPDAHRLVLTLHHIIFDGVSIYRVLVPELAALYDAFAQGRPSPLAEPTLQYGDYALWRARWIESPAVTRQLEHWREALGGELPVLNLPTDRPRPRVPTARGAMEVFEIPGPLTEALKRLSRRQGVTLYMTLLAAFKALLFRYSGQTDLVIGGVTDTRRRPELEPLMGYFLNSFCLRSQPSAERTFADYLETVRDVVLGALGASDIPFDRVVRALQPRRDPSRHPLFQVLFSVEPPVAPFPDGWDLTQMEVTVGAAKFDLYLELDERPDGMLARFLYSTELFDAPTIRRMIGHWLTVLAGVVADPDCPLGRLPVLTPAEIRTLLVDWNATRRDVAPTTVHGLFEAQARRTPDAIALTIGGGDWSYRALDLAASALALRLRVAGVGPETVVALCVERSADMLIGLLAILKAGGAYLPLDPEFPAARLAMILDDARPAVVLTQRRLRDALPRTDAPLMFCDDGVADVVCDDGPEVVGGIADVTTDPENLAYVIYTSGSTGTPKGVEVPHRAVVNLLQSVAREPGFGADDALLAVTTVSFDIAALELFLPLVTGGRVILAERDTVADPARLAMLMRTAHATVMQATPAMWRALIETGWNGGERLKILCGGETLPRDLADRLLARGASVWNLYGPTETTIWSAVQQVRPGEGPVVIGRPLDNTTLHILDPEGHPTPIGVTGELHIGGAGLARGYRNRPDMTAERFAARGVAGERLYRTGDLARWRADGTVECLGRTDGQVKVRGYRVGLGEIEDALAKHPDVAAAAVRAWRDGSGENSLAAYVVPRGGAIDGAGLRRFLRQTLPDYMVPTRVVALPALPLTPNAKVDRNALPEPLPQTPLATVAVARPPDDPVARDLAAIWRDVLAVREVGADDDFFDLGGHSLLLARLLRRVETTFGRRLTLGAVFQAPTLAGMAALLRAEPLPSADALPRTIVTFQRTGARPPLFWLSPGPVFRPLAAAIGPDQPFLGVALEPAELHALPAPVRFEDIARFLVRDIRAVQARGPYYVGGWCTGGILAFEVAVQLRAAGEAVGQLVLLDAVNPVQYRGFGRVAVSVSKLKFHLGHALVQRGGGWRYAAARGRGALRRVVQNVNPACLPPEFEDLLERAALEYVPGPYDGDVTLFQPAERPGVFDYRPGWRDVVRGTFTAHDVPGTHRTVLDPPQVGELGAAMRACLARAQAADRSAARAAE